MKKLYAFMLSTAIAVSGMAMSGFTLETNQRSLIKNSKSAYLMDYNSGECLYKENETARMPIASVCKVMTLTLVFDAVNDGAISLDDTVVVSANAAGMGGSQVFLDKNCEYSVDQLVKSIIVCSANDSCVALSETVAGSEEEFVARMNEKAKDLGCADTLFANCTGLPRDTQYSCAKDVATMFSNLIKNEEYFKYSKIWLEDFVHSSDRTTSMTNTNKLIKRYSFCDGGKTGFTNEAGFCLASTAVKNNLRLVSVVLGASTSNDRFESAINMFEFGFANYKNKIVLDKDVTLNDEFFVRGGKKDTFLVRPEKNAYVFSAVDNTPDVTFVVVANEVKAPVKECDAVGYIEVYKDGVLVDKVNVVAAETVEKAGFIDYFKQITGEWAI